MTAESDLLIESMTVLSVNKLRVRVWKQETDDLKVDRRPLHDVHRKLIMSSTGITMAGVAKAFIDVEDVNAVEVTDSIGNGLVVYKNWP